MSKLRFLQATVGGLLLLYHFSINGFDLNPIGIVLCVLIVLGVAVVTVTAKAILRYYQGISITRQELKTLTVDAKRRHDWYQRYPWSVVVLMAMEGIYALPLLYLGVTSISVVFFALAFVTPISYKTFETDTFIIGFINRILISTIVLPFGIESVMVGAGVAKLVGVFGTALYVKKFHPIEEKVPLPDDKNRRLIKRRKRK